MRSEHFLVLKFSMEKYILTQALILNDSEQSDECVDFRMMCVFDI